jgi:hypothetical protein
MRKETLMTDAKILDLKPCPFCGLLDTVQLHDGNDERDSTSLVVDPLAKLEGATWSIVCNVNLAGCGAESGVRHTPDRAIQAWNERARDYLRVVK